MDEEQVFASAIELPESKRAGFLDAIYHDRPKDRAKMEAMLAAHQQTDSLLDEGQIPSTSGHMADRQPSEQIGPYKLLQKLGEGGMGAVYMAEQEKPVKRVVALKLVKAGLDSKQVVARFEAERQSLAMMDHPNIAKVLDAGTTDRGEPYFVMELVKGVPISEYCDENRLSTSERIELMVDVCLAVQHAHQKGIIHRDLKPSNILVAQYDDRPVPKVIDFGVAKATHQKLTEKTLYTQLGQIVGTLEYMSPEQAVLNQLDVDTRTDVYSLGVILYELLVGVTPLDSKSLRQQGLDQILRTIREEEPPRPSLRLSSQGPAATQTAAYRQTDQAALSRSLRGELDWVVMKALEKDRTRRYESPSRLAEDLNNYLRGATVEARPPTFTYRVSKTWRRNRVLLTSAAAVILALSLGLVGMWNRQTKLQKSLDEIDHKNAELAALLEEKERALLVVQDFSMLFAMTGDPEDQSRALSIATGTGESPGWAFMLKGASALFRNENQLAANNFLAASALEPDNLCYKSMLALEKLVEGDLSEHFRLRDEILTQTPKNSSEEMYTAYALITLAEEANERITRVLKTKNSPLADVIFADVSNNYANMTGDASNIPQALELLQNVTDFVGESPLLLQLRLKLLHTAIIHDVLPRRELSIEKARDCVELLQAFPGYLMGQWQVAAFLDRFGPRRAADEAWERLLQNKQAGFLQAFPVMARTLLYEDFSVAADLLVDNQQHLSQVWHAYCVFQNGAGWNDEKFIHAYERLKASKGDRVQNHLDLLALTGPIERLVTEAKEFAASEDYVQASPFLQAKTRFYCAPDSPEALSNLKQFARQRFFESAIFYEIATVRLCQSKWSESSKSQQYYSEAMAAVDRIIERSDFDQGFYYWAKSMRTLDQRKRNAND